MLARPFIHRVEKEKTFVKGIQKWGFPLGERDLNFLVKNYLNSREIQDPRFVDNTPTFDWVKIFLKRRNNEQCQKRTANIKKASRGY